MLNSYATKVLAAERHRELVRAAREENLARNAAKSRSRVRIGAARALLARRWRRFVRGGEEQIATTALTDGR